MTVLRVATAAWPIERHENWAGFAEKASRWVADAAANGADLLVFPEYGSMELTALVPNGGDLHLSLSELQALFPRYCDLWEGLAERYGITIVAPSFPVAEAGTYLNQAWMFAPGGCCAHQSKMHMTRFEDELWGVSAGHALQILDLGIAKAAIAICYDVEFPAQVHALATAGADLILVPSCTDTDAGFTRVSISARARAIENQCFVVQSSTVGEAPWSPAVDLNIGAAGLYAPADRGFPSDGVLAQGAMNQPGWIFADLDFEALDAVRTAGQVLNLRDTRDEDYSRPTIVDLRRIPCPPPSS